MFLSSSWMFSFAIKVYVELLETQLFKGIS